MARKLEWSRRARLVAAALLDKSLLFALLGFTIGCFALGDLSEDSRTYREKAREGAYASAVIVEYIPEQYKYREDSHTLHYHRIQYAGHEAKINLGKQLTVGTRLDVLYQPGAPARVILGRKDASLLEIIWMNNGDSLLFLVFSAWAAFCWAGVYLAHFFAGESGDFLKAAVKPTR